MKTSLKKLQKFAAHRHEKRSQKQHQILSHDEVARATQDMNDMRDCYDRLLSAAAATANSAYEFSESLREMGDCLLEKTALNDDEESGKVLLMLGKVQFELQRLVDRYRSHIFQTVTIPSESLLNELRIVEEMKNRCDGKREIYEDLLKKHKGRLRNGKGECFPSHQLEEAQEEFDEEANVFVFRMKSLKQGQSRSLLTQACRHHAAQLCFFMKAVRSLEAVEPHVRMVAEQQHIDYQFSGLKDYGRQINDVDGDESDNGGDDDTEDGSEAHDDGELSFDYGKNGPVQEISTLKNSMELDNNDHTFSPDLKLRAVKEILQSPSRNSFSFPGEVRAISKSAPLIPEKKQLDSAERPAKMRPSPSQKFASYVLPTPDETKSPSAGRTDNEIPQTRQAALNLWHSSPLDQNKYGKFQPNEKLSGPIILDTHSVLKESNNTTPTTKASRLLPPRSEDFSFKQLDPGVVSHAKKAKLQAFSGPLTRNPRPNNNPHFSANSGPILSSAHPLPFSGSLLRNPLLRPVSTTKLSSSQVSQTPVVSSSPKISELHELPRPPAHLTASRPSSRSAHSGPIIISKIHEELSTAFESSSASRLPIPPQQTLLSRSYSIPAGGPTEVALCIVPLEGSLKSEMAEDISSSPPLSPISLPNILPASPTS